jgi:hypothetical protein
MAFYDAFFGSDQSLYTAYAIMAAIIAICITILLTATDVSVGNRLLIVLFVIVTLIPSIFLTLFEITCMVTGGTEPNRWWCYAFAWVLAAFIIIYCIFVVIISLISLFTYNNAVDTINETEQKNKLSDTDTNQIAKQIIHTDEETKKLENFYNVQNVNEQFNSSKENIDKFLGLKLPDLSNFGSQPYEPLASSQVPTPPSEGFKNGGSNVSSLHHQDQKQDPPPKVSKFENQNNYQIPEFNPSKLPSAHNDMLSNYNEGFEDYDGNLKLKFSNFGDDFGLMDSMTKTANNALKGFSGF